MLKLLLASINSKKFKPKKDEKARISDFAEEEFKAVISAAKATDSYREKSLIFGYADTFYYLIMAIHKSPAELSAERISLMKAVGELMQKELYLGQKMDDIFSQEIISVVDVEDLLRKLSETKDEYAKGIFYAGLLHYRDKLSKLLETSKLAISDYMAKEMARYVEAYGKDEEADNSLEVLCDACAYFMNEDIVKLLYKVTELGKNNLTLFAARSLLQANKDVTEKMVLSLANDLLYADKFYHALKACGKAELFPQALANEVYLAKSDLVQWLAYPTELGMAPDEIEYIGKAEFKDEVYHIFKYRSESDNLGDDLKGKWLIGWSNDEGGTFSNFDEYEKFDKGTHEKTVKYIKKKLL
ncbi:MAG: hypothetical protein IJW21_02810 [Clostridia bacterium]|nr:hypothetical protein [Clostridia bacterium]